MYTIHSIALAKELIYFFPLPSYVKLAKKISVQAKSYSNPREQNEVNG